MFILINIVYQLIFNIKTEFKQSPLSDIFCGQFRSALSQPGVKDKESVSLEPFFTIPLDIQVNNSNIFKF